MTESLSAKKVASVFFATVAVILSCLLLVFGCFGLMMGPFPPDNAEGDYIRRARALEALEDWDGAIREYSTLHAKWPSYMALLGTGQSWFGAGDLREATHWLVRASVFELELPQSGPVPSAWSAFQEKDRETALGVATQVLDASNEADDQDPSSSRAAVESVFTCRLVRLYCFVAAEEWERAEAELEGVRDVWLSYRDALTSLESVVEAGRSQK